MNRSPENKKAPIRGMGPQNVDMAGLFKRAQATRPRRRVVSTGGPEDHFHELLFHRAQPTPESFTWQTISLEDENFDFGVFYLTHLWHRPPERVQLAVRNASAKRSTFWKCGLSDRDRQ